MDARFKETDAKIDKPEEKVDSKIDKLEKMVSIGFMEMKKIQSENFRWLVGVYIGTSVILAGIILVVFHYTSTLAATTGALVP